MKKEEEELRQMGKGPGVWILVHMKLEKSWCSSFKGKHKKVIATILEKIWRATFDCTFLV